MTDVARRAVLLAALLISACAQEKSAALPPDPKVLPALELRMLDGNLFEPSSVDGKVVVVNFWSPG